MTMTQIRRLVAPALIASVALVGVPLSQSAAAAAPSPRTLYSYDSADGDYIGGGQSNTYEPSDTTTVVVAGTRDHLSMSVDTEDEWWNASVSPGAGDVLRPGTFLRAERDPFRTGRAPGIDVSGNGRGCNQIYGEFTVNQISFNASGEITMVDLSFVQSCESADAPPLRGKILFNQLPLTYKMISKPGDYIGQGQTQTYVNSTSILTLSGDNTYVSGGVSGNRDDWNLRLQAPTGQTLKNGTTYDTARFADATHAGLDVTGNGRGCNQSAGTLTIKRITTGAGGAVERLHVTFVQYCDGSAAPLKGTFRYFA